MLTTAFIKKLGHELDEISVFIIEKMLYKLQKAYMRQ